MSDDPKTEAPPNKDCNAENRLLKQQLKLATEAIEYKDKAIQEAEQREKKLREALDADVKCRVFVQHIYDHLDEGEQVLCKMCGKSIGQIHAEQSLKGQNNV
jgi:hypothetical protein